MPEQEGWQPPAELAAFMIEGPKPVTVGFGSMVDEDSMTLSKTIEEALEKSDQRAVLVGGWGGLKSSTSRHLCIDSVPYDWLYPHVSEAVYHGGAGTTAAALRAGIPQVIVPFFGDQQWWSRLAYHIGVGQKPIPRAKITADNLAAAITAATTDDAIQKRAEELGKAIRKEDGIACAVSAIETCLAKQF